MVTIFHSGLQAGGYGVDGAAADGQRGGLHIPAVRFGRRQQIVPCRIPRRHEGPASARVQGWCFVISCVFVEVCTV